MYMGERKSWLAFVLGLGTNLLWYGWLGGGPGTCLFRERYFGRSLFGTASSWKLVGVASVCYRGIVPLGGRRRRHMFAQDFASGQVVPLEDFLVCPLGPSFAGLPPVIHFFIQQDRVVYFLAFFEPTICHRRRWQVSVGLSIRRIRLIADKGLNLISLRDRSLPPHANFHFVSQNNNSWKNSDLWLKITASNWHLHGLVIAKSNFRKSADQF